MAQMGGRKKCAMRDTAIASGQSYGAGNDGGGSDAEMEEKSVGPQERKAAELDGFIMHSGVSMIPDLWSWIGLVCISALLD
jgi:hypothetical protein